MSLLVRVNPQFVNIPGGTFIMGSRTWDNTQPIKQVTLSPFQMMDAPVTVAQWKAYIEWGEQTRKRFGKFIWGPDGRITQTIWGPSIKTMQKQTISQKIGQIIGDIHQFVPTWREYEGRFDDIEDGARRFLSGNRPAVMIDWWNAAGFCAAIGCELPTEAQYEYAARAGRKGDDVYGTNSGELTAENAHWDHDGNVNETADVRSYAPNLWKLYDMTGNVWEWCSNWRSPNYEGWALKDPAGPLVGGDRALRGGSWISDEDRLRAAFRFNHFFPGDRNLDFGFRVVVPQDS